MTFSREGIDAFEHVGWQREAIESAEKIVAQKSYLNIQTRVRRIIEFLLLERQELIIRINKLENEAKKHETDTGRNDGHDGPSDGDVR